MTFSKHLLPIIIFSICIVGCTISSTGNPTSREFLQNDDADIFQLHDYVFSNAQDVEWVQELEYTLGNQVGEITKQTDKAFQFTNGTANKLPVGTKIFETDSPAYIAIVDGEEKVYLKMVEG
ncbi:hypothetical protein MUN88_07070 [Gracilibacillus caseinilyticus]|uniref:Uncharacterized protein n=1 Tax=Gracilibacillus caseinilyticus TaxID=2932256 RepID=A0ABY4EZZ0_9BACI|nr:hypothetical protein [Gracilibacillus caseinilyticus]UOQ49828.1 hypothetical protein MUN88_07070 [Gracilibacillus caseinilyticus]